ncbi:MAG TPA: hypothetical protein VEK15_28665 [Vicinamibacteria bacterium]|nr:hypothetical protein [Vicinamibacteria bacterium]
MRIISADSHTISVGVETQKALDELFEGVPPAERDKLVAENAVELFDLS